MLTRLRLVNFKSHQDSELNLTRVNLLIGPNNSGKSAFIHALQLLRQTTTSGSPGDLVPPKPHERLTVRKPTEATYGYPNRSIDVGQFSDILHRGAERLEITVEARRKIRRGFWEVAFNPVFLNNAMVKNRGTILTDRHKISWSGSRRDSQPVEVASGEARIHFAPQNDIGRPLISSGRSSPRLSPEQEVDLDGYQRAVEAAIPDLLRSIHTCYGIRGFEEVGYHITEGPRDFEHMLLDDRALAISSAFPYNRDFEDDASEWLEAILGVRVVFEMVGDRRVVLRVRPTRGKAPATPIINEGLGLHQLMFMLLPIALTPPDGTVLVEEPEAHLHPKAQVAVANLMIETAIKRDKQFICTTHGEHILLRFLHAVRQGKLSASDLSIYYVTRDENHVSVVRPLKFDHLGRVEGGLPGFFDQDAAEALEFLGENR